MAAHRTDFQIDASDEQVWAVLVDFENYADWNPSLPSISGDLREGSTVSLTLALPGRPNLNVKAQLRELTPRRLTWRGHLGADRLFTGYRGFSSSPSLRTRCASPMLRISRVCSPPCSRR